MKNVLITGAASGIGRAIAELFLEKGYKVYALDVVNVDNMPNRIAIKADITDEGALNTVLASLEAEGVKLDLIINVAGVHKMASLVESNYGEMKRLIDINLSGTMLVNRTFHRLLSENGRIIIITSEVAGFDPMPFNGLYNVSKTALECYAKALRQELNLLSQRVITVRPGAVKTPLSDGSKTDTDKLASETVLYERQAKRFGGLVESFMGTPIEPSELAKLVYRAATAKRPRAVYKKHHNPGLVMLNLLPTKLQCAIIKMLLNR